MVNPGTHAEMTILVRRENRLEEEFEEIEEEIPVWEKRVKLALKKDMEDLADEAGKRVLELRARKKEIKTELDTIQMEKDMLRKESRRPTGEEVRRAEAMVESVRMGGLIDPDEASLEREFDELETEQAARGASLDEGSEGTVFDFDDEA